MIIRVYGRGNVEGDQGLCESCRHARIVRGRRIEDEIVFCDARLMHTTRITFKVSSCTDYLDSREPPYEELVEKAWILRPASKRRAAGFVRAADLSGDEVLRLFTDPTDRE